MTFQTSCRNAISSSSFSPFPCECQCFSGMNFLVINAKYSYHHRHHGFLLVEASSPCLASIMPPRVLVFTSHAVSLPDFCSVNCAWVRLQRNNKNMWGNINYTPRPNLSQAVLSWTMTQCHPNMPLCRWEVPFFKGPAALWTCTR